MDNNDNIHESIDIRHLPEMWYLKPLVIMMVPLMSMATLAFIWGVDVSSKLTILESKITDSQRYQLYDYKLQQIENKIDSQSIVCDECITELNKLKYKND